MPEPDPPSPPSIGPPLRLGPRGYIALGAVALLLVVAIGGSAVAGSLSSPDSVAGAYMSAVGNNDADGIWSNSLVASAQGVVGGQGGDGEAESLTGEADLRAMLALPENRHSGRTAIEVIRATVSGNDAQVEVRYRESGRQRTETLHLVLTTHRRLLFYPDWRVVLTPTWLAPVSPFPGALITVDGTRLAPPGAPVLPGTHRVTLAASGIFAEDSQLVRVGSSTPGMVQFDLRLIPSARAWAAEAIRGYFADCAARTEAAPYHCPQYVASYSEGGHRWALVGDPSAAVSYSVGAGGGIEASGHYLMTVTYAASHPTGTRHRVAGGTYSLSLSQDGQRFSVAPAGGGGGGGEAPSLVRPAPASDEVIRAAVMGAFQACAQLIDPEGGPDCPQRTYVSLPKNPRWGLDDDPLGGATVSFDGRSGILQVSGHFAMAFAHDTEAGRQTVKSSGYYTAAVVWDGHQASCLYIS